MMMGKKTFFVCLMMLAAAGMSPAFGRLGDAPQSLEQRYGPPVSTATLPGFTRCQYEKMSYQVTVYYQDGRSVMEQFAKRGLSQDEAVKVVALVATHPVASPGPGQEFQIRQATGITYKDEVFWSWAASATTVDAAFNPMECTLAFFNNADVYAKVQQALSAGSLAGS